MIIFLYNTVFLKDFKGTPNLLMSRTCRTLKVELIYLKKYKTRIDTRRDIFKFIEIFSNRARLHSSIGYHHPEEYEKMNMVV